MTGDLKDVRVVVIRTRNQPHKLVLCGLAVLLGVAYLAGAPAPRSMAEHVPAWAILWLWAPALLLHGLGGLAAAIAPTRHIGRAMLVELGAMLVGAGALVVYAAAAGSFGGLIALPVAGFALSWSAANLTRAWQCWRDARQAYTNGAHR